VEHHGDNLIGHFIVHFFAQADNPFSQQAIVDANPLRVGIVDEAIGN
jgi:hypothetical protein